MCLARTPEYIDLSMAPRIHGDGIEDTRVAWGLLDPERMKIFFVSGRSSLSIQALGPNAVI